MAGKVPILWADCRGLDRIVPMAKLGTMADHSWAENAMRCAGARIKALRPHERYSWAYYRIKRERVTLSALYEMHWAQKS